MDQYFPLLDRKGHEIQFLQSASAQQHNFHYQIFSLRKGSRLLYMLPDPHWFETIRQAQCLILRPLKRMNQQYLLNSQLQGKHRQFR